MHPVPRQVTKSSSSSSVYVIGSLTTTFTLPESCNTYQLTCNHCSPPTVSIDTFAQGTATVTTNLVFSQAQKCYDGGSNGEMDNDYNCWPLGSAMTKQATNDPGQSMGIYTPGIYCPAGFTTACLSTGGHSAQSSDQFSFDFTPQKGETAIGCCPTTATVTTSLQVPTIYPIRPASSTIDVEADAFLLIAPLFQLMHHASDMPTTTSTSTSTSTATAKATAGSSPTSTFPAETATTTVAPNSNNHRDLSSGAKAGIGIGVGVGGVLLLVALLFVVLRRRKSLANSSDPPKGVAEVQGLPKRVPNSELNGDMTTQLFELHDPRPVEPIHELE